MTTACPWLVAMTRPRMENDARDQLRRQAYEVYLPTWVELKRRDHKWKKVLSPMFPRYLFVRPSHSEQSISPIRSTLGISNIVRFGTEPAYASEALIKSIQRLEADRLSQATDLQPFKKRELVTISEGAFKGMSAEVFAIQDERVIILMQVLGKIQRLAFEVDALQKKA